ncbi:hypothetical protein Tco_0211536 [Tanacetum coccineum]
MSLIPNSKLWINQESRTFGPHVRTRNGTDCHSSVTGVGDLNAFTRECTYRIYEMQPLYFKGTDGVVELTQWFERMETVFRISNCSAENQIKFATCTLLAGALTWWKSHVMMFTHDVAYSMTWVNRMEEDDDKYPKTMQRLSKWHRRWTRGVQYHGDRQAETSGKSETFPSNQNQQQQPTKRQKREGVTDGSGDKGEKHNGDLDLC